MFTPSQDQKNIFAFVSEGKGNLSVNAVAGSGKSTTILKAIPFMKNHEGKTPNICCLMFGAAIQSEMENKLKRDGITNATAYTVHSICYRGFLRKYGKPELDRNKSKLIMQKFLPDSEVRMYSSFVGKLVSYAKNSGFGLVGAGFPSIHNTEEWEKIIHHHDLEFEDPNAEITKAIEIAKEVLLRSNKEVRLIDFDDQIYLSLLLGVTLPKFDWVLVDECQDLSLLRQTVVKCILPIHGRAMFVGDIAQAIFGFTGADANAMHRLITEFNCTELPLSISYRCSKAVINHVKPWNSIIQAAPNAEEGSVTNMEFKDFIQNPETLNLGANDAILCRNNAPLLQTAFSLLAKGIGCKIEGKKIGQNLNALANKWKVKSLNSLLDRLETHLDKETQKARLKGMDTAAALLEDKVECLKILIGKCQSENKHTLFDLTQLIESLFQDSNGRPAKLVTLCSSHKSKGLEWDRVFLLDRKSYMPSAWATKEWMQIQENNLIYVSITRAKRDLIEVSGVKDYLKGKR
jgi:DNA helicase-2/ATP-dependent DNA helicase PcrA